MLCIWMRGLCRANDELIVRGTEGCSGAQGGTQDSPPPPPPLGICSEPAGGGKANNKELKRRGGRDHLAAPMLSAVGCSSSLGGTPPSLSA